MYNSVYKSIKYFTAVIAAMFSLNVLNSENFEFKYKTGNTYRILSTVNEEVFVNGAKRFDSIIVNRISVVEKKALSDGSADIEARFMTSENSAPEGQAPRFIWGEEYESFFNRWAHTQSTKAPLCPWCATFRFFPAKT